MSSSSSSWAILNCRGEEGGYDVNSPHGEKNQNLFTDTPESGYCKILELQSRSHDGLPKISNFIFTR